MKETSPPRDSRVVAGHSMEMLAAGLARDGVGGERSTSDISGSPGSPSPKEGGREGPAKQNQASTARKIKAGLSKADTDKDKQAQEQERKRRHSDPQQEKAKLDLGSDHDKVQRQQTQACMGAWGKCT